jgi:hypothetical protein
MIRVLLLLFAILGDAGTAFAQAVAPLASGERLEGRFVQERQLKGFNAPLRSEGRFALVPAKGLLWRVEKPLESTTVITATGVVQFIDGSEASRLPSARAPFVAQFYEMLSGALTGDLRALDRDFEVKREGTAASWRLLMTPKNPSGAIAQQIESIAVAGTNFADEVEIRKKSGDSERLLFIDQGRTAGPLSAEDTRLFAAAMQ